MPLKKSTGFADELNMVRFLFINILYLVLVSCTKAPGDSQSNGSPSGLPETVPSSTPSAVARLIQMVSGDSQLGVVGQSLSNPLVVKIVEQGSNAALAGVNLIWAVSSGGGVLQQCSQVSDADGLASCALQLGTTAGSQNNKVTVTIVSSSTQLEFIASALHGPPVGLRLMHNPGTDLVGEVLGISPSIELIDTFGNRVTTGSDSTASVSVQFASGSGILYRNNQSCATSSAACETTLASGLAVFENLRISAAGTKSLKFTKASRLSSGGVGVLTLTSGDFSILSCNVGATCPGCWTFLTVGAHSWVVPTNWSSSSTRIVELLGGGGGGTMGAGDGDSGGGGGGGGGFISASVASLDLTIGSSVAVGVGSGGTGGGIDSPGAGGGTSYFSNLTVLRATGGTGGSFNLGGVGGSGYGSLPLLFSRSGGTGGPGSVANSGEWFGGGGGGAGALAGIGGNGTFYNPGGGGGYNSSLSWTSGVGGFGSPGSNSWGTSGTSGSSYGAGGGGGDSAWPDPAGDGSGGAAYISCK